MWYLIVKLNLKSHLRIHTDENLYTLSQHESGFKAKLNFVFHELTMGKNLTSAANEYTY